MGNPRLGEWYSRSIYPWVSGMLSRFSCLFPFSVGDCFIYGIIAGGPARVVCELAGIKNIRTKSLGSNNKQNVVLATIAGLSQLKTPEEVARNRGKSVEEIRA